MGRRRVKAIFCLAISLGLLCGAFSGVSPAGKPRHVLFQDENLSRAEARPTTISPAPTAGPYARGLTSWQGWGSARTTAEGTTYYDTCEPDCAEGVGSTRGEAILSGVHRCGGQLRYLRLRFVYFGAPEHNLLMTFNCRGETEHLHIGFS